MDLPIGRVIQGDCLDVMRGWPDGCIDAVITDPPYGQRVCQDGIVGGARLHERRGFSSCTKFYSVAAWDLVRPSASHFIEMLRISARQAIFGGNFFADLLPPTRGWYCWDKGRRGLMQTDCEMVWTSEDRPARMIDYHMNNVFARATLEPRVHPTQKPLPVMERLIIDLTKPGDLVLDPFAGSGSTLAACERLGRRWIGIELSAEYCEIARRRTAQKGLF